MARPITCDPCGDETLAVYLLQDISTGDSTAFCPDHYAMQAMGVAEAWANEQLAKEGTKTDEQREVYDDPGPKPLRNDAEQPTAGGSGDSGVSDGDADAPSTAENATAG